LSTIFFGVGMAAEPSLEERAQEILRSCSAMTLATSGAGGPWAADVFFAERGIGRLYFISSPNSRHTQDLMSSSRVAATIRPEPGDWRSISGLQLAGEASAVGDADAESAREVYIRKFPFAEVLLGSNSEIAAKTASTRFYFVQVRRMFLIDNRLGFGARHEVALGA
jgi:uncharacterized protein YhbP (UPF0306 family)